MCLVREIPMCGRNTALVRVHVFNESIHVRNCPSASFWVHSHSTRHAHRSDVIFAFHPIFRTQNVKPQILPPSLPYCLCVCMRERCVCVWHVHYRRIHTIIRSCTAACVRTPIGTRTSNGAHRRRCQRCGMTPSSAHTHTHTLALCRINCVAC